ncbi:MAG: site-specific integrase [Desulfosalsimonadaceae bacterium]
MSIYSVKEKGWRYDFTINGNRYTEAWFKTKTEAKQAEAKKREEVKNPKPQEKTPTDMAFLDLVNLRLDYVKAYNSERHYTDHTYLARRWVSKWGKLKCSEITSDIVQDYLIQRSRKTSAYTANKELRYLRALFNFGVHPKRGWIPSNPTNVITFFPVEKKVKYVPPKENVLKVIQQANPDTQDYLWTIALTMGRMSEVNRLKWDDVDLKNRFIILYTRKKKGGHLTPRKIPMPDRLFKLLQSRYANRDKDKPWVFWHRYWDRKKQEWIEAPFKDRKKIMTTLCRNAGVRYFRYHALRHFGASLLDSANVPIGSIQRILGHENRTTTEIYLHSIGNSELDAMKVLDIEIGEKSLTQSLTRNKKGLTT